MCWGAAAPGRPEYAAAARADEGHEAVAACRGDWHGSQTRGSGARESPPRTTATGSITGREQTGSHDESEKNCVATTPAAQEGEQDISLIVELIRHRTDRRSLRLGPHLAVLPDSGRPPTAGSQTTRQPET